MSVEATWSNWWGSPELFALVVDEIKGAIDDGTGTATISIVITDSHREHEFTDSAAFRAAPAEYLKGFRRLCASCRGDGGSASFELSRPSAITSWTDHATLRVETEREGDESALMEELVPIVEEGYQPYWGGATIPADARADAKRRPLTMKVIRPVVDFILAAVLGAGLYLATHQYGIPFIAPLAGLAGLFVPPMIEIAVPRVEIAFQGKTRLRVIRNRLLGALFAPIGAWVIHLFTGA